MSARPYLVVWNWKAETSKEYASNECCSIVGDCEPTWGIDVNTFLQSVRNAVIATSYDAVDQLRTDLGIDFAITNIVPEVQWFITRSKTRQYRDYACVRRWAKLKVSCTVEFESNLPVSDLEPIIELSPALVWWKWILVGVFITIFATIAAKIFIESLFTKESKTSVTYSGHCNEEVRAWMIREELPPCTICQDVEFNVTKIVREPDWISMLIFGGVAIVGLGVILPPTIQAIMGRGK